LSHGVGAAGGRRQAATTCTAPSCRLYQMPIGSEPPRPSGRRPQQVPIWLRFLISKEQRGPNERTPPRQQPAEAPTPPSPSPLCDPTTRIIAFNFRTCTRVRAVPGVVVVQFVVDFFVVLDIRQALASWPNNWPISENYKLQGIASSRGKQTNL
jgi:hypothetical protein